MTSRLAPSALLLALLASLAPSAAMAEISVAINIRPPALPVYVQPPLPGEGYLWTPGYWGWSGPQNDYYWIPGTWVQPPTQGYLWTPGYWGYQGGGYRWRTGYWGPRVGFYGGIAYGFGYTGNGYHGGRWERGAFHYNTSVNNVEKVVVRNVYNTTVVNNYNVKRVSFNGGPEGVKAEPNARERKEQQAKHVDPTPNQVQHERTAMATPTQKASVNRGSPPVVATPKPSQFDGQDKQRGGDDADDASSAQKKANADRRQAKSADEPQGKREQKPGADAATTPPESAQPAPRDNAAKRAQRAEPQAPQDATDGRSEPAMSKRELRAQRQAESQAQPQHDAQSPRKQHSQQQPEQEQQPKQQPRQQGKTQGESGKDKPPGG